MTHEELHAALVAACDGVVHAYKDDLLVHDLHNIQQHDPRTPFLHFSRYSGTYMVHLIAASEYPAKGTLVPFMFGTADRETCLRSVQDMANYCADPVHGKHTCHHWNGKRLFPIPLSEAVVIAKDYTKVIRMEWERGVSPAKSVTSYVALGM